MIPDEEYHGLTIQQKKNATIKMVLGRIWGKEPRHSETVWVKKGYLYRSTRHDVGAASLTARAYDSTPALGE